MHTTAGFRVRQRDAHLRSTDFFDRKATSDHVRSTHVAGVGRSRRCRRSGRPARVGGHRAGGCRAWSLV